MQFAKDRDLRRALYQAYSTRATLAPTDNTPLMHRILALRAERSRLLGYGSYAELSLVPAGMARDAGLDGGLIASYGIDDRVCVWAAAEAMLNAPMGARRGMVFLSTDREEIGSYGVAGSQGRAYPVSEVHARPLAVWLSKRVVRTPWGIGSPRGCPRHRPPVRRCQASWC